MVNLYKKYYVTLTVPEVTNQLYLVLLDLWTVLGRAAGTGGVVRVPPLLLFLMYLRMSKTLLIR